MKVFVWHRIDKVTDRYHSGGGLLVVAKSLARARDAANDHEHVWLDPAQAPDLVLKVAPSERAREHVMVFPDAGCC